MKCRFKKILSVICVLLLIISVLSLSACNQDTAPTTSTNNADKPTQPVPSETKDTTPNIVGEWRTHTESDYTTFIFHKDMSVELIVANTDDSTLYCHNSGTYTVQGNLITATYNTASGNSMAVDFTYNPDEHTLTSEFDDVFSFATDSVDGALSIVGTWKLLSNTERFRFYTSVYSNVSITFYLDGTFAIISDTSNDIRTSGTYQMIHDGTAILFGIFGNSSSKVMECTFLSENLLYIEASEGRSDNYVWTRID